MLQRHVRRTQIAALLCLVGLASACGASTRTQALRTGLLSLNVARDTVRAASKEHEKQIVDACNPPSCTKEQGHAELDAWRTTVDLATVAIDDGYDAILAASILDDVKSVSAAGAAVAKALDLVKGMKNPAAPPPPKPDNKPAATTNDNKETTP